MKKNSTRHFVWLTLLSAMAITLNLIESIYIGPILFGTLRIGLANIIALVTIKVLGVKEMIIVNAMRVMIGNLLRGTILGSTFWIAMGGVVLSSISLIVTDRLKSSLMFSSVISSICHSLGQVIVVSAFYNQPAFMVILPYFLLGSIPVGLLTGYTAKLMLERIKPLRDQLKK